jgi:hypothetical protein
MVFSATPLRRYSTSGCQFGIGRAKFGGRDSLNCVNPVSVSEPIAVLVVHGIGAQRPGETVGKLVAGLQRIDPEFDRTFALDGQPLRFYEVYWADLLSGDRIRGTFLFHEMLSVCWFPFLNWVRRNYSRDAWSLVALLWWSLVLPLMKLVLLCAYYGAGFFLSFVGAHRRRRDPFDKPLSKLDGLLDEFVGDVFNYVNSAGDAFHREDDEEAVAPEVQRVHAAIMQRFHEQLVKANEDGCREIHVVAHSLGTVVTYHALSGFGIESNDAVRAAAAKVRHLYTIGSPLEKIRFFWPRLTGDAAFLGGAPIEWDNFVSFFDFVAGRLRPMPAWGELRNHRLLGGGFVTGHVVYERSRAFLGAFTRGLLGRELPLRETRAERRRDIAALLGESLLGPAAAILTLLVGAFFVVVTGFLVPTLLGLVLRLFLGPGPRPWIHTLSLVFLGMFVFAIFVGSLIRAVQVHKRYWCARSSETVTNS